MASTGSLPTRGEVDLSTNNLSNIVNAKIEFYLRCYRMTERKTLILLMVNFIYQLGWTIMPDMWSNIILGLSVRVFLDEINI